MKYRPSKTVCLLIIFKISLTSAVSIKITMHGKESNKESTEAYREVHTMKHSAKRLHVRNEKKIVSLVTRCLSTAHLPATVQKLSSDL